MEYWPKLDGSNGTGNNGAGATATDGLTEPLPILEELSPQPDTLSLGLPVAISSENKQGSPPNRRDDPRYKCEGSAEFYTEASSVRTWGTVADISRSGCYIEMAATSPLDSTVKMVLVVNGIRVQANGIVRTSYPLLGMGIAFAEVADPQQLDRLLLHLAGGTPSPIVPDPKEPNTSTHSVSIILNSNVALTVLAKFFQSHDTLTRHQFTELLEKSQDAHNETNR